MPLTKKIWVSLTAIFGIIALFLLVVSIWAMIYTFVYKHTLWVFIGSLSALILFMLLGWISWKKVKAKIIDILT